MVLPKLKCPFLKIMSDPEITVKSLNKLYAKYGGLCPGLKRIRSNAEGKNCSAYNKPVIAAENNVVSCGKSIQASDVGENRPIEIDLAKSILLSLKNAIEDRESVFRRKCPISKYFNNELQRPATDFIIERSLEKLKKDGNYRVFIDIARTAGSFPKAIRFGDSQRPESARQPVVIWCNNDYLGLGQHSDVMEASLQAIRKYGSGSGGTRNISGTSYLHSRLERDLAALHRQPAALLFSSGYVANDAALSTIGKLLPGCIFFSDSMNHASMIQGVIHSRCEKQIFRHNDLRHLENLLKAAKPGRPKMVLFESVYSMDGDVSPVTAICRLARKYGALTFIDEVHAIGLYGSEGGGIAQLLGEESEIDFVSGTLGKAVGVYGGYIAGSERMIDAVRSFSPGFIFTTALPPSVAAAAIESIRIIRSEEGFQLRRKHREVADTLKKRLSRANLPLVASASHIVPLIIGDAALCKKASDALLNRHGIYVQPINHPTVPRGTERFRLSPSPLHSEKLIEELVAALDDVWSYLNIPREVPQAYYDSMILKGMDKLPLESKMPNLLRKSNKNNGCGGHIIKQNNELNVQNEIISI